MMRSLKPIMTSLVGASLLMSGWVQADENLWLYAKGTDTRPEGSFELKLSDITRVGKGSGDYRFHDIRPELEYGITDSLTLVAEILIFDHNYSVGSNDLEPMVETQGGIGERFNKTQYGGYELGLKYNILSPYKDAIGFSVGAGYEKRNRYRLDGAPINQDSFTATLYFQKNFLDDTLVFALTPKVEWERRKAGGVLEEEFALDIAAGVSYRFAPKWFAGLEIRHQSDYLNPQENGEFDPELQRSSLDGSDIRIGSQHQYGYYFGPTIHYAEKSWWATAGILFQVAGGGRAEGEANKDNRNYDEHERYHAGFTLGYEF